MNKNRVRFSTYTLILCQKSHDPPFFLQKYRHARFKSSVLLRSIMLYQEVTAAPWREVHSTLQPTSCNHPFFFRPVITIELPRSCGVAHTWNLSVLPMTRPLLIPMSTPVIVSSCDSTTWLKVSHHTDSTCTFFAHKVISPTSLSSSSSLYRDEGHGKKKQWGVL